MSIRDAVPRYVEADDQTSWYVPTLFVRSRTTGPAYLIPPAPTTAEIASPPPAPADARQIIVARKQSTVSDVTMQGGSGSDQAVQAEDRSAVARAKLRATRATTQHIEATEERAISDVDVDDRTEDSSAVAS